MNIVGVTRRGSKNATSEHPRTREMLRLVTSHMSATNYQVNVPNLPCRWVVGCGVFEAPTSAPYAESRLGARPNCRRLEKGLAGMAWRFMVQGVLE